MTDSWQNHCLVYPNMLSEKCEDCVLLLYQWNKAKFQLANSCHLMEYTLFPNILQHVIFSCAHILALIVTNPQWPSDTWGNKAYMLSSDHKIYWWNEADSQLVSSSHLHIDKFSSLSEVAGIPNSHIFYVYDFTSGYDALFSVQVIDATEPTIWSCSVRLSFL
jgi:hypothetical protein